MLQATCAQRYFAWKACVMIMDSFSGWHYLFFFFFCIPQPEIIAYVTVFQSNHWGSHISSLWMVHAWCVFVAGIHPSRTWTSGSFVSVQWNAYVHRLDLGLYSHLKEFWGTGVRTHVNSKGKIPSTGNNLPRGGWNPRHCMKQDSEPNTVPTGYSGPFFTVLYPC